MNFLSAALGVAADRLLGEPPDHLHPVAGFGSLMGRVEEATWADRRTAGATYTAIGLAVGVFAGALIRSTLIAVLIAAAGRQLRAVADNIGGLVIAGDLDGARAALPSLVGRDPSQLDQSGIAAAVIESVAENSVDAVIAPVFWGVVAGAPGALGYRAINTMDAIVGHRTDRYRNFGWAAARLDDVANYLPARLFALLVIAAVPHRRREIFRTIRRDAGAHPSPNAGVSEAAVAAALGCELGGPLHYGVKFEDRPRLGSGPRPDPTDIDRANRLARRTESLFARTLGALGLIAQFKKRRNR